MRAALVLLTGTLLAAGGEPARKKPARAAEDKPSRTDRFGDPLPHGAIARMGSIRLRHAGLSGFAFLSGGKTVLTAGGDRVLRTWDTATGKQVGAVRLQGRAGGGYDVTLSHDGKTLVDCDRDRLVFYEVESGKELKSLPAPRYGAGYLDFSPDGKTLAVGDVEWRVTFWDWRAGKAREAPLPVLPGAEGSINSTFHGCFSPDGKWFVSGAYNGHPLGVYDTATARLARRLACNPCASAVSPDGKRLAVAGVRNGRRPDCEAVILIYELATGRLAAEFPQPFDLPYRTLTFSPDGKTLLCGFARCGALLDVATGRVLQRLPHCSVGVRFSPDGKTVAAMSGPRLRLWDVATGRERHDRPDWFAHISVLAVSPDGRTLATDGWQPEVTLWDTSDGRLLRRLPLKNGSVYDVAFSADGRTLIAHVGVGRIQFWDATGGQERRTLQLRKPVRLTDLPDNIYGLHFWPDGKHVAGLVGSLSGDRPTRLALWETATGMPLRQAPVRGDVHEAAWSANGNVGALWLTDNLAVFEAATCRVRLRIPGTAAGGPAAMSPDGRLIACQLTHAGAKPGRGAVGVWDTATGKKIAVVPTGLVQHLALTPEGRFLVTTDVGFLRVWDLATSRERRLWPLPEAVMERSGRTFVYGLVLSPDGRRAFTALADGTALVWDLGPALSP